MSETANFELDYNLEQTESWDGQGGNFLLLPQGIYDLEIIAAGPKNSNAGNPGLEVEFSVANEGEYAGKTFKRLYNFTETGKKRVANLLKACGARLNKVYGEDLVGQVIQAEIVHTEGKTMIDPSTGQPKPPKKFMDVIGETRIEDAATEPTKAPAKAAAPAPAPAAVAAQANTNGKTVRRAVGPAAR